MQALSAARVQWLWKEGGVARGLAVEGVRRWEGVAVEGAVEGAVEWLRAPPRTQGAASG